LAEKIVERVLEEPYRKTAEAIVRPFTGKALTEGRKAIHRLVGNRVATELMYR
jgi:hypothetical protein